MADTQRRNATPQEVHDLMNRLHDQGVVNLDTPMRATVDQVRSIRLGEEQGWYICGGDSYFLVVSE
jgi:hypothetical protein